jgi:hypothetical protein
MAEHDIREELQPATPLRFKRLVALLGVNVFVGCGSTPPIADQPPAPVAIDLEARTEASAVWQRLATDKLSGLALVWADAVFYPTADAARQAAPKRQHEGKVFGTVEVLEDLGDVVKVRTWLSPRVREGMQAITSYDLTLYASRNQLLPVVRETITKRYEDGTGYVLNEGMPLAIDKTVTPLENLPGSLAIEIPHDHIGLSFPLRDTEADKEPLREELVCEWPEEGRYPRDPDDRKARVLSRSEKAREQARERQAKLDQELDRGIDDGWSEGIGDYNAGVGFYGAGMDYATCDLAPASGLSIGGEHVANAGTVFPPQDCDGGIRVFGSSKDTDVIVLFSQGRAVLRMSAPKDALEPHAGCAAMGGLARFGRGGKGPPPPPPKVLALVGKTRAYFPSGEEAGYHMERQTKVRDPEERGSRLCIPHANVSVKLCFERADLQEIDDR